MARVPPNPIRHSWNVPLHTGAIAGAAAIFLVDVQQPLGYAVGLLYALVILLGLWSTWQAYSIVAAAVAIALLVIDLAIGWSTNPSPSVFVNGLLMVLLFVATAALVRHVRRLEQQSASGVQQLADLKHAIDQAAIVATTDVTGRITYVNDRFCEISKYSRAELLGQDHRIINSGYHEETFIRDLWQTIANGRVWRGELRNRAKDDSVYWVDTTIVPFLNTSGKPYQYIAIRADVTALKAAEARLAQQAALARLGQMAAVVAHEVRNPLAGIKGAVQVLISRRAPTDTELPVMRDIVTRIDALSELINDLMIFARPRPPRLSSFDVQPLIVEAVDLLRRDPANAALEIAIDGPSVALTADAELLRAAVLNMLLNAAQALSGQGRIAVEIRQEERRCVVDIRDTGPGIPAAIREQIFEPFFTTKSRGGGLGLAITRRTAELHGGSLTVACPDTGGSVFTMALPIPPMSPPS